MQDAPSVRVFDLFLRQLVDHFLRSASESEPRSGNGSTWAFRPVARPCGEPNAQFLVDGAQVLLQLFAGVLRRVGVFHRIGALWLSPFGSSSARAAPRVSSALISSPLIVANAS